MTPEQAEEIKRLASLWVPFFDNVDDGGPL